MTQKIIDKITNVIGKIIYSWFILALLVFFLTFLPLPKLGSLEEVENANPKYVFKDGNFQNLVEEYHDVTSIDSEERYRNWNLIFYRNECEIFSPNWKRVNECISTYKLCEINLPLGKYNEEGNHAPEFLNNLSKARDVYFDAKETPDKYPEYTKCINSKSVKWTSREYGILAMKILYIIPVAIVALPIEYVFGTGSAHFITGSLD